MNGSNPKRMYVMENVRDFVALHNLQAGSMLSFYYAPDNRLVNRPILLVYLQLMQSLPSYVHSDLSSCCTFEVFFSAACAQGCLHICTIPQCSRICKGIGA